jgi:hypothetical protein
VASAATFYAPPQKPHAEQAISMFKEIKAENELALAYSGMGRYHKQHGEKGQAHECLSKTLEIFGKNMDKGVRHVKQEVRG